MKKDDFINVMESLKIEKYYFTDNPSELKCYECWNDGYIKSEAGLSTVMILGDIHDVVICKTNTNHTKSLSAYTKQLLSDKRVRLDSLKEFLECDNTKVLNYGCKV